MQINETAIPVAIQGNPGSYHESAASHYFGDAYSGVYKATFSQVFEAIRKSETTHGMVAIENALVGSIVPVYELLRSFDDLTITGELYLAIHHNLMAVPGAKIEHITEVFSHTVALDQCTDFLKRAMPAAKLSSPADTAGCAQLVKDMGRPDVAAIAGANNAERLGLEILAENVENNAANFTRFVVLQPKDDITTYKLENANKTSLLIERLTDDDDELAPGTLYQALGCFAISQVGLTKIESRPIDGRPWHYLFYVDCAAGIVEPKMQKAIRMLDALGSNYRLLGSYAAGRTYSDT